MTIIQRLKSPSAQVSESENPYLSARRTWSAHADALRSSLRFSQAVSLIASIGCLTLLGHHLTQKEKTQPIHVVEVDSVGRSVYQGAIASTTPADPRILKAAVAAFITDARLVTPDIQLQRQAILRIFSQLTPGDPATQKMKDWLNGDVSTTPFARAQTQMVNVDIQSVIPQTTDTWQVQWLETVRDRNGVAVDAPLHYRALVTVYSAVPSAKTPEEQLRMNPLGIFINDYSWQQLQ